MKFLEETYKYNIFETFIKENTGSTSGELHRWEENMNKGNHFFLLYGYQSH